MDWTLTSDPEITQLRLNSSLTLNNMEAMLTATIDGHGIAYMPDFLVKDVLARGELETLLDGYTKDQGIFWAVWPSSRHLSPKIRVFVDFICSQLFKHG